MSGGLSNACILLGKALGAHVTIDSVGAKTWSHSIGSLGHAGQMVVLGATTGIDAPAEIRFMFRKDLTVMGHKMGTLEEFRELCRFVEEKDIHPAIARVYEDLEGVRDALKEMAEVSPLGKLVIRSR